MHAQRWRVVTKYANNSTQDDERAARPARASDPARALNRRNHIVNTPVGGPSPLPSSA